MTRQSAEKSLNAQRLLGISARYTLVDMHCHLDFATNAQEVAACANDYAVGLLSVTVTPQGYKAAKKALGTCENVCVGLGLHPWWVCTTVSDDLELFERFMVDAPFIGEVGLDFSTAHQGTANEQLAAFERIVQLCAEDFSIAVPHKGFEGRVISFHAVRAASYVLGILERYRLTQKNACILHWFSGSSDELQRAIKLGCYFSVGERMLQTKRGRAYVKAIPEERIFLETDLPANSDKPFAFETLYRSLLQANTLIASIKNKT